MTLCPCGCQREVLSPRARHYSAHCRLKASQAKRAPAPATVRSTRILKDGTQQVIVHVKPLWAVRAARGDEITIGACR
jgi:hypothetical protein